MATKRDLLDLYISPERYDILGDNIDIISVECNDDIVMLRTKKEGKHQVVITTMRTELDADIESTLAQISIIDTSMLLHCESVKHRFYEVANSGKRLLAKCFSTELPADCSLLSKALVSFSEAEVERALRAVDALEQEMKRFKISPRRLSAKSVAIDSGGALYPIFIHNLEYDRNGRLEERCTLKCAALRDDILNIVQSENRYSAAFSGEFNQLTLLAYGTRYAEIFTGHIAYGTPHEERVWVNDDGLFGYVNMSNEVIVPSIYLWAGNFAEGRAIVRSEEGFGAIDTSGKIILAPKYAGISFDVDSGFIYAKQKIDNEDGDDAFWAQFSYTGEQLSPFDIDTLSVGSEIFEIE